MGLQGTIGKKVVEVLKPEFDIIEVNRTSSDYQLNMQNTEDLEKFFKSVNGFDTLVATNGYGKWGTIDKHSRK